MSSASSVADLKHLQDIADAIRQLCRVTEEHGQRSPETQQAAFAALDAMADELHLLNECRSRYGCYSITGKRLAKIEEWATLDDAKKAEAYDYFCCAVDLTSPPVHRGGPFDSHSWGEQLGHWMGRLSAERARQAGDEKADGERLALDYTDGGIVDISCPPHPPAGAPESERLAWLARRCKTLQACFSGPAGHYPNCEAGEARDWLAAAYSAACDWLPPATVGECEHLATFDAADHNPSAARAELARLARAATTRLLELHQAGGKKATDGGQAEAEWVKRLASEVYDLVRKPDILKRFHEMMKQWRARYREQAECNRQWTKRREQHFETLAALPEDDPRRKDSPTPPEPGWVWEPEFCVPSGGKLLSIKGWVPPDLAQSREPEIEAILPLVERALRLDEKYTLLAAVHDSDLRGATRIAPWPDSDLEAIPYEALRHDLPDEIEGARHKLRGFLEDVKQDAERARQEPKGAGAAQEIVKICDEMLRLGREPGSGAGFIITPRHPSKRPKRKGKASPDAKTGTAVGEYQPRSGPSGILGRMGQARDAEWQALSAKFDSRAERLADLMKALDPTYDTGTFYSPAPVSVYVAYPKARKMLSEDERLWLREKDLADGKTEAEADAFLAQLDALQKARTRNMWTKMQWPGYVVDVPGHRRFLSPPELVHPFDRRFNTLKNWAAERARQEPAEGGQVEPASGVATPKTDPGLIYQADAATFYNIPKSVLSKAAKKEPGQPGYLWSGRNGKHVFYRKKDMEAVARSRAALGWASEPHKKPPAPVSPRVSGKKNLAEREKAFLAEYGQQDTDSED